MVEQRAAKGRDDTRPETQNGPPEGDPFDT
jgi:hypothetical protein